MKKRDLVRAAEYELLLENAATLGQGDEAGAEILDFLEGDDK